MAQQTTDPNVLAHIGDATRIQGRYFVERESLSPTSIAAAQAETINVTGTEVIDAGYLLSFQVNGGQAALTTAANLLTYVAIKTVSGLYIAVAFNTQINGGLFTMPVADQVNIVTRNQDTAAHVMSGYWQATRPETTPGALPGVRIY